MLNKRVLTSNVIFSLPLLISRPISNITLRKFYFGHIFFELQYPRVVGVGLEISPYLGGDFAQLRLVYVEGEKFLLP